MKTSVALVVLGAWLLPVQIAAQADAVVRELRQLEDRLSRALVELDVETVDRLFHPELVFIGTTGAVSTKDQRLSGMRTTTAAPGPDRNVNDELVITVRGQTAFVVVTSTWTYAGDAAPPAQRFRALHVWTRDDEQWRLRAAQVAVLRE
jgi:ketosteroid isomerase-like protein